MQKDDITFVLARKNLETEIVISDKDDEFNVLNILGKYGPFGLNFLIGHNAPRIEEEKAIILQKIRTPFEDFMGLKPYLKKEAHQNIHEFKLSHSLEITGIIEQALALFKFDHFFDSPTDYLKLMANELLMNAFYNANPAHRLIPRSTEVHEENSEKAIRLSIGADEQGVFLSVKDFYGTLKKEHILNSLIRGLSEKRPLNESDNKAGGAGLGLTMTFNHCNIFIVNSSPSKSTEIIIGIEYNKRFKKYKERITSFHFFVF
jgi:sigma-B regulation protein RsbU (phosphoserine phosphatase)